MFVSLRGPNPLSGPHAIAGDTPGFSVLDATGGLLLTTITVPPVYDAEGKVINDPHGIGVRSLN